MSTSRSTLSRVLLKGAAMPSNDQTLSAENCNNMAEVRAGVDAVDLAIIELLSRRFGYMDAAARIKSERSAVRDESRKRQVLDNVIAAAQRHSIPIEPIGQLWEQLVEASIAYEAKSWDDLHS
jgi:isochorismate pyruvate lyase